MTLTTLENFYADTMRITSSKIDLIEKILKLRSLLKSYLQTNDFVLDCAEAVFNKIYFCQQSNKVWYATPIYQSIDRKIKIKIIPWPPKYQNNPHQHKTWGITGILHNKLTIKTFNLMPDNRLAEEKNINASSGEVGYILPNHIHNIYNPSDKASLSFHIFDQIPDTTCEAENAIWYPAPINYNLADGIHERTLVCFLEMLETIISPRSEELSRSIKKLLTGGTHHNTNHLS